MTHAQPPRRIGTQAPGSERDPDHVDLAIARVRPSRGAPRLPVAMWLVAAFVVIAVAKPWGGGGPAAETLRPEAVAAPDITPTPTEDRSATGLAVPVCLGTGAWRVATLETWRSRDVRVWRAIEPIDSATGPLDARIPSVPVVADVLSGLGWCAPAFGDAQPLGPARVMAWQVIHGVARSVALRQVQPVNGSTPIAALYVPATGSWTSGLIVFEYEDEGSGAIHWFGADVQVAPTASASGLPTADPAATSPAAP